MKRILFSAVIVVSALFATPSQPAAATSQVKSTVVEQKIGPSHIIESYLVCDGYGNCWYQYGVHYGCAADGHYEPAWLFLWCHNRGWA